MRAAVTAALALLLTAVLFAGEVAVTPAPPLIPRQSDVLDAVASDGHGFYVLFNDYRPNFHGATLDGVAVTFGEGERGVVAASDNGYLILVLQDGALRGWRVGTHGEPIDTAPFEVVPSSGRVQTMAAAWDGSRYVVYWLDQGHDLHLSSVDRERHVAGGDATGTGYGPLAVAASNGVSVVASEGNSLMVRSTAAGFSNLGFSGAQSIAAAAGEDGFLVVWIAADHLYAHRLDGQGRALGTLIDTGIGPLEKVDVARDGDGWLVVTSNVWPEPVRAFRVSASGAFGKPFDLLPGYGIAAVASDGTRTLAALGTSYAIYTRFIDTSGLTLFHPIRRAQNFAHSAFDGVDDVVTWAEAGVRMARVTTRGRPLDGSGIVVRDAPSTYAEPLQIAGGDGGSIVLWRESGAPSLFDLRAMRFDAAATPLDPTPLRIASNCENGLPAARAVWDGSAFVVFWSCGKDLQATRIGSSAAPSLVYPAAMEDFDVVRTGDRFLVLQNGDYGVLRVFAVLNDLRLATPLVPLVPLVGPGEWAYDGGALAFNGEESLVVWNDSAKQMVAQRISRNAAPIGPRIVVAREAGGGSPRVRWEVGSWIVTWPTLAGPNRVAFVSAAVSAGGAVAPPHTVAYTSTPTVLRLSSWSITGNTLFYSRKTTADEAPRLYFQHVQE